MEYLKPQKPIKFKEDYIYPLTTADQVIVEEGQRLSGVGVYLSVPAENAEVVDYLKPSYPLKNANGFLYPQTTADQVLLADGSKLEKDGQISANRLVEARTISLVGDVVGSVDFDGSHGVTINTAVSASNYYTATFYADNWGDSAPYSQTITVDGINASDNPIVDINMSSATDANVEEMLNAWSFIARIVTNDNSITGYCYTEKPEMDVTINLLAVK